MLQVAVLSCLQKLAIIATVGNTMVLSQRDSVPVLPAVEQPGTRVSSFKTQNLGERNLGARQH